MLEKKEKAEIETLIHQQIATTTEKIKELKELTKPIAPENSIGRVSRMDAINNKSINEAALRKAEEKLSKLEYALSRLDQRDFGICAKCNGKIQQGRIILMPESRFCVRCASR